MVQLHGFDWGRYSESIMPAFEHWLVEGDETAVQQLFVETRCAQEEQFLPTLIRKLSIWPRASAFVATLPRGPHSLREYHQICSATQFTSLSDRYLHHHAPKLYQESDALRTIWGALVEHYILSWNPLSFEPARNFIPQPEEEILQKELVALLQTAGLESIAREVYQPGVQIERLEWKTLPAPFLNESQAVSGSQLLKQAEASETEEIDPLSDLEQAKEGISLGQQTDLLQLRGWLARISVQALVLFEYLAFGRRCMPFGYNSGEPFGSYIGYLTPQEVGLLEQNLQQVKPPSPHRARQEYQKFRSPDNSQHGPFHFVDEIMPAYALEFLNVVRIAAYQKRGLICETN